MSHLLQMRGLKLLEIPRRHKQTIVASFTDAWIETCFLGGTNWEQESHLLQMRGLKHKGTDRAKGRLASHLLQMRGLKPHGRRLVGNQTGSHLLQMRGLKHTNGKVCRVIYSRIFYRCVD